MTIDYLATVRNRSEISEHIANVRISNIIGIDSNIPGEEIEEQ